MVVTFFRTAYKLGIIITYFKMYRLSLPTSNHVQNNSNKLNDESRAIIDEGKKLLVGSVKQVTRWCRLLSFLEQTKIIYQVFGTLYYLLL